MLFCQSKCQQAFFLQREGKGHEKYHGFLETQVGLQTVSTIISTVYSVCSGIIVVAPKGVGKVHFSELKEVN